MWAQWPKDIKTTIVSMVEVEVDKVLEMARVVMDVDMIVMAMAVVLIKIRGNDMAIGKVAVEDVGITNNHIILLT